MCIPYYSHMMTPRVPSMCEEANLIPTCCDIGATYDDKNEGGDLNKRASIIKEHDKYSLILVMYQAQTKGHTRTRTESKATRQRRSILAQKQDY